MIIVIMGVAGSGKTTVGQKLASRLQYEFLDADWLHPPSNVAKMAGGIPLTDADRAPWLEAIHSRIVEASSRGKDLVVACSALKQSYRDILSRDVGITWVYLKGADTIIRKRLQQRSEHFMKPEMLASQFADLEEPGIAIVVDVVLAPDAAVAKILNALASAETS